VPIALFTDAPAPGGRAQTLEHEGFRLNFGPHRLYGHGAAAAGFRELGVRIPAAARGPNGGLAICRGHVHTLPVGHCSLMATDVLPLDAKLELARFLAGVPRIDTGPLQHVSLDDWLRTRIHDRYVLNLVTALIRSATYSDELHLLSAAAAVEQLALSVRGPVLYVHGGWGSMVEALHAEATARGATVHTNRQATRIVVQARTAQLVEFRDGTTLRCRAVIVTTSPDQANALFAGTLPSLPTNPVHIATLDVALRRLPQPRAVFACGIDEPVCFSADSSVARVAPDNAAVVHVAKYLRSTAPVTASDELQLERVLDVVQPGWRALVVHRRFIKTMIASHALVMASNGGFGGRPDCRVPFVDNAYLAGDWVGPTGQLADASVASALRAARAVERLVAA